MSSGKLGELIKIWLLAVWLAVGMASVRGAAQDQPTGEEPPAAPAPPPPAQDAQTSEAPQQTSQEEAPAPPPPLMLETPQEAPEPQLETPQPISPEEPTGAAPAERPAQETIEEIIFRGNRRVPAATLRARILSHPGDVYNENALERDFMALWNTGFLDDVRLEVSDGEKGKIVTFYVREKKLVRSIDYKGLSSVQASDVLDRFRERKVGLSIQAQFDPVVVKRAQVVLKQLLAERGRQFASVRTRTRNIPPNSVALTFIVVEGPKVKIGKIRFQGNTVFSNHRLVRAMKYSRPVGAPPWFYWFHKTYDKDRILADLELNIRTMYQDNGYFYVVLKEPEVTMMDTKRRWPFFFFSWGRGKRVDINLPVEEGSQYRLGRFVIRGNKLFKQDVLSRVLQLEQGEVFNLGKVRKSIENYQKLYGAYGYINFTASPDIEPDNKKKLINLALDFEEGKQFFVHRIEFSGNTKTRDKVMRRELLVDEGNVFNSELWDYSTLRINQLGFFDQVKKEDYEIKQNPREGTVDILLKVKEKGRNSIGFSGGVSGLAGNFVGINYATNNFLGLGETLSLQMQVGTYQKLYSFGFTEPYLFDRAITTGFTVFKSDFRFDQLRQAAAFSGISPNALAQSNIGQSFFQNFSQNSSGFTMFASYPLRRSFGRVGLTYSFSVSSLETFSAASQNFFTALNFRGIEGPNALSGITSSQVMPTYIYNTTNHPFNPTRGRYLYAALSFSGSILGGNVNTIRPVVEFKYFRPVVNRKSDTPHVAAFRVLGSMVSGFGGRVPPPFSRFYVGGEDDIRGFYIRSVSPMAFYPTVSQVCNRDSAGNLIEALDASGRKVGTCGSFTRFPSYTLIFPGGDTMLIANAEYRVPIVGPVTMAYFLDVGSAFVWRDSQLKVVGSALESITKDFPFFPVPKTLKPIGVTNFSPRASTGIEVQVVLPVVNAPFRVFWGYNFLRLDDTLVPPQNLPPESIFPNKATYDAAVATFSGYRVFDRKSRLGFTVARTF
ncbi:MAG: outer membrane protein assembly factor BamA [Acidobacteria bacterium]|nr:outer membrane protein assembly factor BamA [Acidobacteriota bacterium]